jgi:AcrR family transcriptional regulator
VTPVPPKRADARRNRERLLDAAAAVLSRETDPTLLDIAEEAGVSRATAYRHFSDVAAVRAALADEVMDLARDLLSEHLTAGRDETVSFPEWLVATTRAAMPIRTRYAEAMAKEPVPDAGLINTFTPMAQALVKQAQSRSEIRADLDPAIMAEGIITVALYTARRVYRDGLPIDDALQIFETFMRGMETSPRGS